MIDFAQLISMLSPQAAQAQAVAPPIDDGPPVPQFAPPAFQPSAQSPPQAVAPPVDDGAWVPGATQDGGMGIGDVISKLFGFGSGAKAEPAMSGTPYGPISNNYTAAELETGPRPTLAAPGAGRSIGNGQQPAGAGAGRLFAPPPPASQSATAGVGIPTDNEPAAAAGPSTFQNFIRDVLAANANGDPRSKVGAFMGGAGRASQSAVAREQAERAQAAAASKEKFGQTLALRKDTRDERGANRDDENAVRQRAATASQAALHEAQIAKINEGMKISKAQSGIPGLTVQQAQKMNDQLNVYGRDIKQSLSGDVNAYEKALKAKRDQLIKDYLGPDKAGGQSGDTASAQGPTATHPTTGQKLMLKDGKWVPVQ